MMIFHVDVNSAFLSWSALKRLEQDPGSVDLRTIPSVVGGDAATRHGIVTAKSIPAKKYGIRTAEPVAQAMKKCPGLVVVKSDFATYRKYSNAFMEILRRYTPMVEKASIDEAYLDVTELGEMLSQPGGERMQAGRSDLQPADLDPVHPAVDERLLRELAQMPEPFPMNVARKLKDEVRDTLGFTVNVGISTNKLLAKMASDFEKPDRIHTLYPEEVPEKMWPLPLRELYGCGARTAARLEAMGMHTIQDAATAPLEYLQSILGEKAGQYIWRSANGLSGSVVHPQREEAKSCSNEITTPYDITLENYEKEMPPLLKKLSEKVAGRLRKDGFYAGTVVVTVKTSDFVRRSIQAKLPDPTNRSEILYQEAERLAGILLLGKDKDVIAGRKEAGRSRTAEKSNAPREGLLLHGNGIRLVGVGTTDLDHGQYRQLSLADLMMHPEPEQGTGTIPNPPAGPVYKEAPASAPVYKEAPVSAPVYKEVPVTDAVYKEVPVTDPVYKEAPVTAPVQKEGPAISLRQMEAPVTGPDQEHASSRQAQKEDALARMAQKIRSKYGNDAIRRGM